MSMTVRLAGFADLATLRGLYRQFLHEPPERPYPIVDGDELDQLVRTLATQFIQRSDVFSIVGAWEDDEAIGFLGVEIGERQIGRPHKVINVHWLYVIPSKRGIGVAKQMIAHGLEWLRTNHPDITHVEWFSAAGDVSWERRGFRPFLSRYVATLDMVDLYQEGPKREPHVLTLIDPDIEANGRSDAERRQPAGDSGEQHLGDANEEPLRESPVRARQAARQSNSGA